MIGRVAVQVVARDAQNLAIRSHALLPRAISRALYIPALTRDRTQITLAGLYHNPSLSTHTYVTDANTTTAKPGRPRRPGRPKLPASEKKTGAKKPGPPKQTTSRKTKAARKKKPATKKKPAAKTPRAKKPRVKKALTPDQQLHAKVRDLRQKALRTPKLLPHLARVAEQNKVANVKTLNAWIETHTPDDIRAANNARRLLNRLAKTPKAEGRKTRAIAGRMPLIKDVRVVKRTSSPYIAFVRDRWASGDYKDTHPTEAAKALGQEWKQIDAAEKQRYQDAYKTNREQYIKDYNAIFTKGIKSPPHTPVQPEAI